VRESQKRFILRIGKIPYISAAEVALYNIRVSYTKRLTSWNLRMD
jgi:hypothetical protein